jgi:hypothetical protein
MVSWPVNTLHRTDQAPSFFSSHLQKQKTAWLWIVSSGFSPRPRAREGLSSRVELLVSLYSLANGDIPGEAAQVVGRGPVLDSAVEGKLKSVGDGVPIGTGGIGEAQPPERPLLKRPTVGDFGPDPLLAHQQVVVSGVDGEVSAVTLDNLHRALDVGDGGEVGGDVDLEGFSAIDTLRNVEEGNAACGLSHDVQVGFRWCIRWDLGVSS